MENLSDSNMFAVSITLLKFIGETKHHTSSGLFCFRIISCCTIGVTMSYIFYNFFAIEGKVYVKTLQSLSLASHLLLKYLLIVKQKYKIEELLEDIVRQFWNYRDFGEGTVQAIEQIYKIARRVQIVMLFVSVSIIYAYFLRPLFISNSELLFESVLPNSLVMDAILLVCHYFCFCVGIPVIVGYDLIYFALCVHVVLQLRLLKLKMKSLLKDYANVTSSEINSCIGHHQFLFSMFLRMKRIYSAMLLFHYFITLFTTCSILFEVLTGHTDVANYIAKLLSILFFFGQFACYTFPAEQVAFEFSDMADSIYLSHWYENNVSTQKALLYVMLNSQRAHYFSGVGLIDINVDAFGSVVRKSFSFYAIIKNLLNK